MLLDLAAGPGPGPGPGLGPEPEPEPEPGPEPGPELERSDRLLPDPGREAGRNASFLVVVCFGLRVICFCWY